MGNEAARCRWVFGADPYRNTSNPSNNVVNSTGAGATFNCHGWGETFTFYFETNDSGWAYQLRSARNSSGPWAVFSSNSGTSTSGADVIQIPGPFMWLSPRVDSLSSTANFAIIEMRAQEG